jgi:hypothetical protein
MRKPAPSLLRLTAAAASCAFARTGLGDLPHGKETRPNAEGGAPSRGSPPGACGERTWDCEPRRAMSAVSGAGAAAMGPRFVLKRRGTRISLPFNESRCVLKDETGRTRAFWAWRERIPNTPSLNATYQIRLCKDCGMAQPHKGPRQQIMARPTDKVYYGIRKAAEEHGMSISQYVADVLALHLGMEEEVRELGCLQQQLPLSA